MTQNQSSNVCCTFFQHPFKEKAITWWAYSFVTRYHVTSSASVSQGRDGSPQGWREAHSHRLKKERKKRKKKKKKSHLLSFFSTGNSKLCWIRETPVESHPSRSVSNCFQLLWFLVPFPHQSTIIQLQSKKNCEEPPFPNMLNLPIF